MSKKNKKKEKDRKYKKKRNNTERTGGKKARKKSRSSRSRNLQKIRGILDKTRSGAGFVVMDEADDVYIPASGIGDAMDGDEVEAVITGFGSGSMSASARITRIIKRNHMTVVGRVRHEVHYSFILPMDNKSSEVILLSKKNAGKAENGDIVLAKIIRFPAKGRLAEGRVMKVIADADDPAGEVNALVAESGVRTKFNRKVRNEAEQLQRAAHGEDKRLNPSLAAEARRDLRGIKTVTIDGADSKDFDDAVSLVKKNGIYTLYVSIADVSEYVQNGSELDKEAFKRGNSIYLADRVIPMLPEELSNDICSLNPNEDRLTLTCEVTLDGSGKVINHDIYESVIRSDERLVYDDVSDLLENNDQKQLERYADIADMLRSMKELSDILRTNRMNNGSIDFDIPEAEIVMGDDERPSSIELADRRCANMMIEEFMLLANRVVAEHFNKIKCPFVYRVHETPESDRIADLRTFLTGIGINTLGSIGAVTPEMISRVLSQIKGTSFEAIGERVILRSMQKARYDTECLGHYGLAFDYYCHFTSPIRRYPDLMVHRIIKAVLHRSGKLQHFSAAAEKTADHCSETERQAIDLERSVEKLMKVRYMAGREGERDTAVISGITSSGFFAELPNTVEGFVRFDTMSDYYEVDEKKYRIVGRDTGRVLKLGDKVEIEVYEVSEEDNFIDFVMQEDADRLRREDKAGVIE